MLAEYLIGRVVCTVFQTVALRKAEHSVSLIARMEAVIMGFPLIEERLNDVTADGRLCFNNIDVQSLALGAWILRIEILCQGRPFGEEQNTEDYLEYYDCCHIGMSAGTGGEKE
nr:hypothetical protein CFP56_31594 [Quercus suber]